MKKYYFLFIALTAMVYTSCSKLDGPAPETPDPLKEINLTDTLSMYAGNVIKINYTITPASYDTTKLVWASSDTSVVAVTNSGKISAKKEGTSIISVSNLAKTVTVNCHVSVKDSLSVGLLAYYPFNNSAADFSGHNNNGTVNSVTSVADRFGAANSAYYFDGLTSFIKVADKQELRLANTDFTLSAWVKLEDYDSSFGAQILNKRFGGEDNGWYTSITGEGFVFSGGDNVTGLLNFGKGSLALSYFAITPVGLNDWYLLTTVYNANSKTMSFYINGIFDAAVGNVKSPNKDVAADLYIGRDNPNVPSTGYLIKGTLDDVRIYKRALTAKEIKRLHSLTH